MLGWKCIPLFILLFILMNSKFVKLNQEEELYKKLLTNYFPFSRPVKSHNLTVNVNFKVKLNQVVDLSAKENILVTNIKVEQVKQNLSNSGFSKALKYFESQILLLFTFKT